MRLTQAAHQALIKHLNTSDVAIDATIGNGHDSLFLCQQLGNGGHLYGFDLQEKAIEQTRQRLQEAEIISRFSLLCQSHANMQQAIPADLHGKVSTVMFNLGYLPGGDKQICTCANETLQALEASTGLLRRGGLLSIIAYPGQEPGRQEAEAVNQWCARLNSAYYSVTTQHSSHPDGPCWRLVCKI